MEKFISIRCNLVLLLIATLIILGGTGCSQEENNSAEKKNTIEQKSVAMVFPVTVDAFVDFRIQAEKELSKEGITLHWFSAEGDPSRFSTSLKAALLKKPDILIPVGTQLTALALGTQFENELPPVVASCVSAPEKVEALVNIGLAPDRSKSVAILSDSPKHDIYSFSANTIKEVLGNNVKVGILYNTSAINAKNTAQSLSGALSDLSIDVMDGIVTSTEDVIRVAKTLISNGATLLVIPHDKYVIQKAATLVKLGMEQETPIPIFSLDDGTVRSAGVAFGISVSYGNLGKLTARTCLDILKGQKAESMPIIAEDFAQVYINQETIKQLHLNIPDKLNAIVY